MYSGLKKARVLVLGLSFRSGVREFRKSPAKKIIELLKSNGIFVRAFDPVCSEKDAVGLLGANEFKNDFEGIDCVVITTNAKEFKQIDWKKELKKMRTKIVVDGRQVASPDVVRGEKAVYRGIGRL